MQLGRTVRMRATDCRLSYRICSCTALTRSPTTTAHCTTSWPPHSHPIASVHVASQCDEGLLLPARHSHAVYHQRTGQHSTQHSLLSPHAVLPRLPLPVRIGHSLSAQQPVRAPFYCPNSHAGAAVSHWSYCPGETLEPIPCPPSTFNNLTASPPASPVPIGYYCPVSSLLAAHHLPRRLCVRPSGHSSHPPRCARPATGAMLARRLPMSARSCRRRTQGRATRRTSASTVPSRPYRSWATSPHRSCAPAAPTACSTASAITGSATCGSGHLLPARLSRHRQ